MFFFVLFFSTPEYMLHPLSLTKKTIKCIGRFSISQRCQCVHTWRFFFELEITFYHNYLTFLPPFYYQQNCGKNKNEKNRFFLASKYSDSFGFCQTFLLFWRPNNLLDFVSFSHDYQQKTLLCLVYVFKSELINNPHWSRRLLLYCQ